MHKLDPIEAALARLMPPALSQSCQQEIEAMFDELAGADSESVALPEPRRNLWAIYGGVAAAVVAVAAVFPLVHSSGKPAVAAISQPDPQSGLVLVSESDRIESMIDEGWRESSDGSAMHAVRVNLVEENSLRDEETGIVFLVSEPREVIHLMPISSF